MCGGSPLITGFCQYACPTDVSCRGDFTGEEIFLLTLVLPSNYFSLQTIITMAISCRGEYTGEEICNYTLVLPSLNWFGFG